MSVVISSSGGNAMPKEVFDAMKKMDKKGNIKLSKKEWEKLQQAIAMNNALNSSGACPCCSGLAGGTTTQIIPGGGKVIQQTVTQPSQQITYIS